MCDGRWIATSTLILVVASLFALPTTAAAEHDHRELDLASISAQAVGGTLRVHYRVDRSDWRRASRSNAEVSLEVEAHSRSHDHSAHTHRVVLDERAGTLRLPRRCGCHIERIRTTVVSAPASCDRHDHGRRHDRDRRYGERHDRRTDRCGGEPLGRCDADRGDDHGHRHDRDRGGLDSDTVGRIAETCDDHTIADDDRRRCLRAGTSLEPTRDAVAILNACEAHAPCTDSFLACATLAAKFRCAPIPNIRACGEATDFSSRFVGCLRSASRIPSDAERVVRTCHARHPHFDRELVACVDRASRLGARAARRTRKCHRVAQRADRFDRDEQFERCMSR